ncbi:response regulator [Deminuibacter soli]|uniref:histidine kinase n=1 Tax=Deminuibacter soli TaxID=2291815 RepID=A0A3E1NCW8_9BACT|nr:response regulator [Deminuibacter soli]RFM25790.1 hybrid sensor histidine kinase/response regulator [Deminuibacter soli]
MQTKILVVDDREDNLLSIDSILAHEGYQLVKAGSGREALKILLTEIDFALILMDVKMPNLSGFETAELIYAREKLKHIPIVFITANSYDEENTYKGYQTGAVDYIYKPINPQLLRAKVGVFVDLYKKNQRLLAQERRLIAINQSLENEISERKASEEKVKVLNQQLLDNIARLESTNKELDRFAFMASHDLQEPLRKMLVFSDRLTYKYKDIIDEEAGVYISKIQHAGARMQRLIEDIRTFSKISVDNNSLVESDMNALLGEVLHDLEEKILAQHATVDIAPLPSLYVNPGLIGPLFSNLIGNALKYTREGVAPVVRIRAELAVGDLAEQHTASQFCRIYVQDNGIGFEQEYADQIFGMFKRLHPEYDGTGIGLAICKKIMEEHHGFITAIGKVNEGATFIVSFPVKAPVQQLAMSRARGSE